MKYQEVENNDLSNFPLTQFVCRTECQNSMSYDLTTWEYFEGIANAQGRSIFVAADGFMGLAPSLLATAMLLVFYLE